jgi:hypothetical protein
MRMFTVNMFHLLLRNISSDSASFNSLRTLSHSMTYVKQFILIYLSSHLFDKLLSLSAEESAISGTTFLVRAGYLHVTSLGSWTQ